MKVTDAFLGEHAVFYAQFAACERTLTGADVACLLREAALIASALEPHAQLENTLLFDDLQARAGGGGSIFEVMEQEHTEIERMLAQIQQARDAETARQLLMDMIQAARDHFAKEERLAFPMAEQLIGAAELVRLGERWAEARGVSMGDSLPAW